MVCVSITHCHPGRDTEQHTVLAGCGCMGVLRFKCSFEVKFKEQMLLGGLSPPSSLFILEVFRLSDNLFPRLENFPFSYPHLKMWVNPAVLNLNNTFPYDFHLLTYA